VDADVFNHLPDQSEQLFNPDETSPYDLQIRETMSSFKGFSTRNMDVKTGRQHIARGTADKLKVQPAKLAFVVSDRVDVAGNKDEFVFSLWYRFLKSSDHYSRPTIF
jgi:hypothetical protein